MCGIIAYFGKKNAVPVLIDGLKKLEYRGYDSAGLCLWGKDDIRVLSQQKRGEKICLGKPGNR